MRSSPSRSVATFRLTAPLAGMVILLAVLLLAGGSNRGDALGQVLVRAVSWGLVVVSLLFGPRPHAAAARPAGWLLAAALAVALVQLVPLPPALWQALPGRDLPIAAGRWIAGDTPWRSLSMVPGATINAAGSLVVPLAALLLMAAMEERERRSVVVLMLVMIATAMVVGLAQLSGAVGGSMLIRDDDLQASGTFANRNHFSLLLVLGCLMAPAWAGSSETRRPYLRGLIALGCVLLFALTILAIGSRAGLGLFVPALAIGLLLARRTLRQALAPAPRWVVPALLAGALVAAAVFVLLSISAGRAISLDRVFAVDIGQDMRTRGLPVVVEMVRQTFPAGTGLGSFDPMFRAHEPFALLKPTYFNHAHNDFLEVVLDAGLPGLLLMLAGVGWWVRMSVRAWRRGSPARLLPRLGSAVIGFVIVASAFDYPARTPTFMAILAIAAVWLGEASRGRDDAALTRA